MSDLVDVVPLRVRGEKRSRAVVLASAPLRGAIKVQPARDMVNPRRWAGPEIATFCPAEDMNATLPPLDSVRLTRRSGPTEYLLGGLEEVELPGKRHAQVVQVWWVRVVPQAPAARPKARQGALELAEA